MKSIIILFLFPSFIYAQSVRDSVYISKDSLRFKIGEYVTFGHGTMPNGDFKFIYLNTQSLLQPYDKSTGLPVLDRLTSNMSELNGMITKIRTMGSKKIGFKYELLMKLTGPSNYQIEIEDALASGEILKENSHKAVH